MSIRDRIRERIEELETNVNAVQDQIKSDFLKQYLLGRTKGMNTDNLMKLAKALKTTPEWLLEGRGEQENDPALGEVVDLWTKKLDKESRERVIDFARFQAESKKAAKD